MTTLTKEERRNREMRIRRMLDNGANLAEIADVLGISRQAVWCFCARRNWLPDDGRGHVPKSQTVTSQALRRDAEEQQLAQREQEAKAREAIASWIQHRHQP